MQKHTTLRDVLAFGDEDAIAIAAPSSKAMTFGRLREQIEETGRALSALGAGRRDRVAIVLPNGPEMAAAFLSVASHAASAPLNPSYKAEEFEFYLSDLGAKLLIVEAGSTSPSIEVANKLGVKIVSLNREPDRGAGSFTLTGEEGGAPAQQEPASGDDIALVLHTSGTTSRPKIVPLSQRNLCASAWNIAPDAHSDARRPLPFDHAAFSHPRADRDGSRLRRRRRQRVLHARLPRLPFLHLALGGEADLV